MRDANNIHTEMVDSLKTVIDEDSAGRFLDNRFQAYTKRYQELRKRWTDWLMPQTRFSLGAEMEKLVAQMQTTGGTPAELQEFQVQAMKLLTSNKVLEIAVSYQAYLPLQAVNMGRLEVEEARLRHLIAAIQRNNQGNPQACPRLQEVVNNAIVTLRDDTFVMQLSGLDTKILMRAMNK